MFPPFLKQSYKYALRTAQLAIDWYKNRKSGSHTPPPPLSIGATDARLLYQERCFYPQQCWLCQLLIRLRNYLPFLQPLGVLYLHQSLIQLNSFISFSTSWTFTLFRTKQVGLFKLSFIFIMLGCVLYLLIIKSIADESSIFVMRCAIYYDL